MTEEIFEPGDVVHIKPEWCNSPAEATIDNVVLEYYDYTGDRDIKHNRVKILTKLDSMALPITEVCDARMVTKVGHINLDNGYKFYKGKVFEA